MLAFINAQLIRPDRIEHGAIGVVNGRLTHGTPPNATVIDCKGDFLAPGFVDLHVHGGDNSDFMDLTPDAFRTVCRCHARHGTTSLTPTSTVASEADYARFVELCESFREDHEPPTSGARIVGTHLYGPYFLPAAKGCHPNADFLSNELHVLTQRSRADFPLTVTIAPELSNAEQLTRAAVANGIRVNIGHSFATLEQVEAAIGWGARHVDHLFCAMSDRARLKQTQPFPMRGGVMESTLIFDELTTEVIADAKHLADSLLRVAYRLKGADKLCLVTDSMRAVDCPDGEYWFGPHGRGERIRRVNDAGVTLDGNGLASGVMGMDFCVRTMLRATGAPLAEVIRMASLTPAKVIGLDHELGSLEVGKRADVLRLSRDLQLRGVWIGGVEFHAESSR
jgi:N-acetylglucosamine-6-phosphate deacetylase